MRHGQGIVKACLRQSNKYYSWPLPLGVLAQVVQATVANVTARTLCAMGDSLIIEETSKVFKNKKDMKKGENQVEEVNEGGGGGGRCC